LRQDIRAIRNRRLAAIELLDDRRPVDGIQECLAHTLIGEARISQIEPEIVHDLRRTGQHRESIFALQTSGFIESQIGEADITRLQRNHGTARFREEAVDETIELRAAAPVVVERFEFDVLTRNVFLPLERTGADRIVQPPGGGSEIRRADVLERMLWKHHQEGERIEQGHIALVEVQHDRQIVRRVDRGDTREFRADIAGAIRGRRQFDREFDIGRGERFAIVPRHAIAQMNGVFGSIRVEFPAFRQITLDRGKVGFVEHQFRVILLEPGESRTRLERIWAFRAATRADIERPYQNPAAAGSWRCILRDCNRWRDQPRHQRKNAEPLHRPFESTS